MSDVQVAEELNVTFTHEGGEYTVAKASFGDLDVVEPWEDGKYVIAVRELLGPEQWRAFRSTDRTYSDCLSLFSAALDAAAKKDDKDD